MIRDRIPSNRFEYSTDTYQLKSGTFSTIFWCDLTILTTVDVMLIADFGILIVAKQPVLFGASGNWLNFDLFRATLKVVTKYTTIDATGKIALIGN